MASNLSERLCHLRLVYQVARHGLPKDVQHLKGCRTHHRFYWDITVPAAVELAEGRAVDRPRPDQYPPGWMS